MNGVIIASRSSGSCSRTHSRDPRGGLSKRFGDKRVFEGLDFELQRGGFLLVTGPNGVGQDDAAPALRRARVPTGG